MWEYHFWGRKYFSASSEDVTDGVIIDYVINQEIHGLQKSDNFRGKLF